MWEKAFDLMGFFFVMVGLMKFVSTMKMLIMLMSLEFSSIFLFFLLCMVSHNGGGFAVGVYSLFLVLVVCEGVLVLVGMINIYRKGSMMVKSMYLLKF